MTNFSNSNNTSPQRKDNNDKPIIMCIGVGGGGSNVVNYMHKRGLKDVILIITNTDQQALQQSNVPLKLQLGPNTTNGLGAGANPEVGATAALESKEEINKMLSKHIKIVFITACMGGGTGTGAASIIASIAKEKGILVIGVVTTPFFFEGAQKQQVAEEGIKLLKEHCDTLIIIENERLMKQPSDMQVLSLRSAFEMVDEVLYEAVTSITDPINQPGIINVDFCDVHTMLSNAGHAVIGTGFAEGEGRGMKAIQQAVHSPLLRHDNVKGSTRLLLSVTSGLEGELTLQELARVTSYLKEVLDNDDIMVIWGHAYDKNLGSKVRISIIASGFPENILHTNNTYQIHHPTTPYVQQTIKKTTQQNIETQPNQEDTATATEHDTDTTTAKEQTREKILAQKIEKWHRNIRNYAQHIDLADENTIDKEMLYIPTYKRKNISFAYKPVTTQPPIRHQLHQAAPQTSHTE